MITDSDLTAQYLPDERDYCTDCGIERRHGLCHICDADEIYEQQRMWEQENAYRITEDTVDAMKEISRGLDDSPWSEDLPALARRQAS